VSRNFELLSQLGKMQELLPTEEMAPSHLPTPEAAPDLAIPEEDNVPSIPTLEMSGTVKDEISKLVQNLFLGPQNCHQIVFAGCESGSGSTWTCAHAGEILAQTRGTVCVVDCHLRAPRLHEEFGQQNHHGLSDALIGTGTIREYVCRISRRLWLLSCGSAPDAGQNLLSSTRMRSRMAELRATFDYVLIDAPPLNASSDAIMLGVETDGVVLMLKANSSRRESAKKAVQDLRAANVRTLGAVLNQRTFPIPEKLYRRL